MTAIGRGDVRTAAATGGADWMGRHGWRRLDGVAPTVAIGRRRSERAVIRRGGNWTEWHGWQRSDGGVGTDGGDRTGSDRMIAIGRGDDRMGRRSAPGCDCLISLNCCTFDTCFTLPFSFNIVSESNI